MQTKLLILRIFCLAAFLLLLAALARLQLFQGSYFHDLANNNRVREIPLPAPRGIIFDRNGRELVINLPAWQLQNCPSENECTSSIISKDQAISLETSGIPKGAIVSVDSTRSYTYGPATAHLLGYVSEVTGPEIKANPDYFLGEKIGRGGVEEQYNINLSGKPGKELVEVDALGNKLRTLSTLPPTPGQDINLSIDINLQKAAYEQIKNVKGAVVATDPRNGQVLALASSPSFDPNLFTEVSTYSTDKDQKITRIFSDPAQPLFNRAIGGTYPSGSTFKIVVATAGLESGKITEDYTVTDPGILVIGPYKFPNWLYLRGGGTQGTLNVVSAIKVSNDIFFYKVGESVGVDGLADWAQKFGLNSKLGIDLPGEATGTIPTASWRAKFARDWYLGDTYHLAIGQGDLLVTPLQVNRWTSVIANGGRLCKPHVLSDLSHLSDLCKSLGVHQKTIDLIKEGMIEACSPGGTAYPLFNFAVKSTSNKQPATSNQIQIACKTGTAEYGDPADKTHAWLTAFAPAENPTIAITVLVEGGGEGSDVAAPMVKKILEEWFSQ